MKIVGKIFAVIFCIIYFFVLMGFMVFDFAGNVVSSNYYANIFENIDLETIKVSDLKGFFNEGEYDSNATLEDVIVNFFSEEDIEERKVKALLNDKTARKTIGKVIGDLVSYAMGGEKPAITRNDIKSFFNNSVVTDITGIPTEENIDYVYEELNKAIEEVDGGKNVRNSERNSNSVKNFG